VEAVNDAISALRFHVVQRVPTSSLPASRLARNPVVQRPRPILVPGHFEDDKDGEVARINRGEVEAVVLAIEPNRRLAIESVGDKQRLRTGHALGRVVRVSRLIGPNGNETVAVLGDTGIRFEPELETIGGWLTPAPRHKQD